MKKANLGFWVAGGMMALGIAAACSSSDTTAASTTSSTGGPTCAPTDPDCAALGVKSDCLALVDNAGKNQFVLRLSQLEVTAPKALTNPTVKKVVGDGVNINLPKCNVPGKGTFSLITEFDLDKGTLRTGGASPEASPADGYCYVNDSKNGVAPVDTKLTVEASTSTFSTAPIAKIVLPVYVDVAAKSAVFLPVTAAKLSNGKLSADHNCIGSFNAAGLEPINSCLPDPEAGIEYFVNGATLSGYITIAEADDVIVDLLGQSLCVLLSGDAAKYGDGAKPAKCKRTGGKIDLEGDWCDATDSAGGCKDSFILKADLAASSVKLRADCPGAAASSASGGAGGSQ